MQTGTEGRQKVPKGLAGRPEGPGRTGACRTIHNTHYRTHLLSCFCAPADPGAPPLPPAPPLLDRPAGLEALPVSFLTSLREL